MTDETTIAFWTANPPHWSMKPTPEPYLAVMADMDKAWETLLSANGYQTESRIGKEYDPYCAAVWRHVSGHAFIEVENVDGVGARFFVDSDDFAAFMVDKWPAMIQAAATAANYETHPLAQILAAFIRHGHGKHVVSEDGKQTMEEIAAQRQAWERRRKFEREQQAGLTPSGEQIGGAG